MRVQLFIVPRDARALLPVRNDDALQLVQVRRHSAIQVPCPKLAQCPLLESDTIDEQPVVGLHDSEREPCVAVGEGSLELGGAAHLRLDARRAAHSHRPRFRIRLSPHRT